MFLFVLIAGLGLAVHVLWRRLGGIAAQQAQLSAGFDDLSRRHEALVERLLNERRSSGVGPPAPAKEADVPASAVGTPTTQPAPPPDWRPSTAPPPFSFAERAPTSSASERPLTPPTLAEAPEIPSSEPALAPPQGLESFATASRWLIEFFTTGNVVAKVGMVVVFFGVAFLLRYAVEQGLFPIEYRLMATAAGALVLLGAGWRLRHSRREYAIVLQGGAVGLLYLTIFAAFRLYGLLPASLAFALLLVTVAFSGVLAVVQNAIALAVLGTSGGFLAPILASTGAGSHVALFSYYAVLNLGVLGIAWFRAWRFLNWLAFVFTFGIGFMWGQEYYEPAFFATTEPFLVLFFLLFVAISLLFAHRQPPLLRGYIDGSLVFGTPAIAFGMQSVLVGEIPFGRAYSAVVLSGLYLVLTRVLWRRDKALRPLAEAFLALAVVFLILAVPLAFDGHATAAAWALEGAGLIWIGTRQHRLLARLVGAALLLGAGIAFGVMATPSVSELAVLNTQFLGCAAIAAGSVLAGLLLSRARESLRAAEGVLEWVLLVWGLLWWFGAVQVEILEHVSSRLLFASSLLAIAVSGLMVAVAARRLDWRAMMQATIPIGPLMWIWVAPLFLFNGDDGPLPDLGWLAWPVVLVSSYLIVFWFELVWPRVVVWIWHVAAAWLLLFLTTWTLAVMVRELVPEAATWSSIIWCIVPAMFVVGVGRLRQWLPWPVQRFESIYMVAIPSAPVAAILAWVFWASALSGSAAPLPYVPLLNPLEMTQAFAIIASLASLKRSQPYGAFNRGFNVGFRSLLAALAFLAINVSVGRVVHFYLNVPFNLEDLVASSVFQTGLSILWGVTAGVLMTVARRWQERSVWMVGAALLAALTLKLFVVDLGNAGTIARIVSFLVAGVLILLIGYFAPAPPRSTPEAEEEAT